MKPARSPRFQSEAERCSIAAISCCGSPRFSRGAEHATAAASRTTHHVPRTVVSLTWPREHLVETLPRMCKRMVLAAAFLLGCLLFLLCRFLLLRFRPRLLGGFLFLLRLRLGRRARRRL